MPDAIRAPRTLRRERLIGAVALVVIAVGLNSVMLRGEDLPAWSVDVGRSATGAGAASLQHGAGTWIGLTVHHSTDLIAEQLFDSDRSWLADRTQALGVPAGRLLFPATALSFSAFSDGPRLRTLDEGQQDLLIAKRSSLSAAQDLLLQAGSKTDLGRMNTVGFSTGAIHGASLGLAMTLARLDAATAGDLTGGLRIAATGQVSSSGIVSEIGSMPAKAQLAAYTGADVLLVPAADTGEAVAALSHVRGSKPEVVGVPTIRAAVLAVCAVLRRHARPVPALCDQLGST